MKRDHIITTDGTAAGTMEEAKKRAALAEARAHRAKVRLKQARKAYKDLKKAAKKARKWVKSLKERAGKHKAQRASSAPAKQKARHKKSNGTEKQVQTRPVGI